MDLLLVKMSSLGDVIQALPLAARLRKGLGCRLHWAVNSSLAPLVSLCPDVARVVPFPRENFLVGLPSFLGSLRRVRYELVVDVQGLFKSGLVCLFSGGKRIIGLASAREGAALFYTEAVGKPRIEGHAVDRCLQVASHLGLPDGQPEFNLQVAGPSRQRPWGGRKVVAINPFARWESKRWPLDRYARLADMILEEGLAEVIFLGGSEDRPQMELLMGQMNNRATDLVGSTDLVELANVLHDASLLVCNDSGPMHLAAALGTSVIALFGPTSPERTGPFGPGHRVLSGQASCAPCFLRRCPGDSACLLTIQPEEVYGAVRQALKERDEKV